MKKEFLNRMLKEVGLRDGIPDLELGNEGTAALELASGEKLFFEYQEKNDWLFLYIPLLNLPSQQEKRLAVFEKMLDANFLKLKTGKGEFSIQLEKQQAVYQVALVVVDLNSDRLNSEIDEIIKQYRECLHVLENIKSSTKDKPSVSLDNSRFRLFTRL